VRLLLGVELSPGCRRTRLTSIRAASDRQALSGVGVWLLCLTLLAPLGCRGGSDRSSASSATAGGATLHIAQTAEPTTFDPALVQDGPTIEVLMHVFDGLVEWTPQNKLAPALAERWEVSPDGRTFTFHLRPDVRFQNGRLLKASDFIYSINRSLLPETRSTVAMSYLNDIVGAGDVAAGRAKEAKGLSAPDAQTLKITIDAPKAYFLSKLTYPTAYALCREIIEARGGHVDETNLVGTGPFRLTEYRSGGHIILERNPSYFEGPPKLARIERAIVLDAGTRHSMFESGQLDIVDVTMADLEQDRKDPELSSKLHYFNRPAVYYAALNQTGFPPFKDRRVRQAFSHAVDKDRICSTVLLGVNQRAAGILPPGVPGYDPQFTGLVYDVTKAKSLLAAAGFPEGRGFPPLTLTFRERMPDIKRVCEVMAEMLRTNLGIDVTLRELEWGKFLGERNHGAMPFYFLRWAADYLDPQNFTSVMLRTGAPENRIGYNSPEFDRLCDQGDVEQDPAKRLALYRRAQSIAVTDAPWSPVYFQKDVELWNPRLRGVEDSLMGHLPHKRTTIAD
jgi:oligopeptide transport system substrate-binding protein